MATVKRHRNSINGGNLPNSLKARSNSTLVVFDSKTRAQRLAGKLTEALEGATASHTRTRSGYAVQLSVGTGGLTLGDRVMLQSLGLAQ